MSSAITPDVVGYTEILEESPMTEQEQKELIETETVIKSSFQGKMERDLAIGAGLLKIKRQKLYRGISGGRLWVDYLKEESAKLTGNAEPISDQLARNLRGFYRKFDYLVLYLCLKEIKFYYQKTYQIFFLLLTNQNLFVLVLFFYLISNNKL